MLHGQIIKLIVGLGNPGVLYKNTRHNAGYWLIEKIAQHYNTSLDYKKNFCGNYCKLNADSNTNYLLCPDTFMNNSGQAVIAISQFYQIQPANILIAYDDIDLPIGEAKLQTKGSHNGHNGIKDIIRCFGADSNISKLRIGVGRPSVGNVDSYVLSSPPLDEREKINQIINKIVTLTDKLFLGQWQIAIQELHSYINLRR